MSKPDKLVFKLIVTIICFNLSEIPGKLNFVDPETIAWWVTKIVEGGNTKMEYVLKATLLLNIPTILKCIDVLTGKVVSESFMSNYNKFVKNNKVRQEAFLNGFILANDLINYYESRQGGLYKISLICKPHIPISEGTSHIRKEIFDFVGQDQTEDTVPSWMKKN